MHTYHNAKYWNSLAENSVKVTPNYAEELYLANLVIEDPINYWTKRALRKAVCVLIAQDPQACINQILVVGRDSSRAMAWHGLVHDRSIMKCFRSHIPDWQYKKLQALVETSHKKTRANTIDSCP